MNAFGLGVRHRRSRAAARGAAPVLASINAAGWSAQWASGTPPTFTPDTAPQTIAVTRAGFDGAGMTTSYAGARTFTRRVRSLYPNQATDAAAAVALDDYVYASDSIAGVVNNSTEASPKPIAAWVMPHRLVVGGSLHWELVAFHRDFRQNRQVACVIVTATDSLGASTAGQVVSTTALSTLCEDACPVEVFGGDLPLVNAANGQPLANGIITLRGRVFPWIGAAASVLDSNDQSAAREFSPRYFLKSSAAKTLYYVKTAANGGSDATGAGSTVASTASGTPFASVLAAINKAHTDLGATTGIDMAEIRIGDDGGTPFVLGSPTATRAQNVAALTITRDPAVPRANARVSFGAAGFRARFGSSGGYTAPLTAGAIRFYDVGVVRTGALYLQGEATAQLEVSWHNVAFDNGGFNSTYLNNAHDRMFGVSMSNVGGGSPLGAGTYEHRLWRGLTVDMASNAMEGWVTVGCAISRLKGSTYRDPIKGAIHYANKYLSPDATAAPIGIDTANAGETITGFAVVQNLIEVTHTTASTPALRVSSDTPLHGNTVHVVLAHNTVTGYGSIARCNNFYDNNAGAEVRTHRLMRDVGNIYVQLNTKGDIFVATSGSNPTDAPNHVGQLAYAHGVGCQGNLVQYRTASANFSEESQAYPGLGSKVGTSTTAPLYANAAIWTNYQGTPVGAAAPGIGSGSYTLATGSPARNMVTTIGLTFDLAGTTRGSRTDSAGAFR